MRIPLQKMLFISNTYLLYCLSTYHRINKWVGVIGTFDNSLKFWKGETPQLLMFDLRHDT